MDMVALSHGNQTKHKNCSAVTPKPNSYRISHQFMTLSTRSFKEVMREAPLLHVNANENQQSDGILESGISSLHFFLPLTTCNT